MAEAAGRRRSPAWPSPEQELLLKAALLRGTAAIDAWHAWRARVALDALDRGSVRLLPLLARNLERQGVDDPSLPGIHDLRRRIWAKNTYRLTLLGEIVRLFGEAGIDTMVLKGAALIVLHYPEPGLRPMDDVDVLVPYRQARTAIALLRAKGWAPVARAAELLVPVTHGHGFQDRARRQLDLHWHVMWECCAEGDDDDFWSASIEATIEAVPTRALCPTDQLLHVCVHGARWNEVPSLRWVADASAVLETHGPDIDWDRLVRQTRARRLVLPVREALGFLSEALGAPVPGSALSALRRSPISALERVDHGLKQRPRGFWEPLGLLACHYLRSTRGLGPWRRTTGLPRYLQGICGAASPGQLPAALLGELSRRIGVRGKSRRR
jgi:hypothetical protein